MVRVSLSRKLIDRTGPPWTKKEASIFYSEFTKKGPNWAAIVEKLGPARTEAMVRALHARHREYLSQPRTSLTEFVQQVVQAQTDDTPTRKRRRTTENINADEVNEEEGVEALTEFAQALRGTPRKNLEFENKVSAETAKRKRSEVKNNDVNISDEEDSDDVSMTHNPNSRMAHFPYLSADVRKLRPIGAPHPGPHEYDLLQAQFSHCLSSQKFRQFAIYEWFYAVADRLYFSQNEFTECLHNCGFGKVSRLTRKEWAFVRNVIGKPRRLSRRFLSDERGQLEKFRANVRKYQETSTILPPRLLEGQRVSAIHPQSFELHLGTVVGTATLQSPSTSTPILHYRVKFERSSDLPALVPDSDVMPQGALTRWSGTLALEPEWHHSQEDLTLMANVLRLMDQKRALVDFLQHMNFVAEEIKWLAQARTTETHTPRRRGDPPSSEQKFEYPLKFKQQCAAVMLRLEKVNTNLESSLAELRWRSASQPTLPPQQQPLPFPMPEPSPEPALQNPLQGLSNSMSDPLFPFYSSFFSNNGSSSQTKNSFPPFPPWPPAGMPQLNGSQLPMPGLDLSFAWPPAPQMFPIFNPSWPPSPSPCSSSSSSSLPSSASTAFTTDFSSSSSMCPCISSFSCNSPGLSSSSSSASSSSSKPTSFSSPSPNSSCSCSSSSSLPPYASFPNFSSPTPSSSSSSGGFSFPPAASFSDFCSASAQSFPFPSPALPPMFSSSLPFNNSFPDVDNSLLSSLAYSYPPPSIPQTPKFPRPASGNSSQSSTWSSSNSLSSFPPLPPFSSPPNNIPDSPRHPTSQQSPATRFHSNTSFPSTALRLSINDPMKNVRYEKEVFVENILETLIREKRIGRHSSLHTDTNAGIPILRLIVACISLIHVLRLGHRFPDLGAALAALAPSSPQNQKVFESIAAAAATIQRISSQKP